MMIMMVMMLIMMKRMMVDSKDGNGYGDDDDDDYDDNADDVNHTSILMVTVVMTATMRDDEDDDGDGYADDEGNDDDDDDDDYDCNITKMYELTCSTGVDNKVKNSADAILPISMFVVVCICFAVKITSMVSKLPVTRTNEIMKEIPYSVYSRYIYTNSMDTLINPSEPREPHRLHFENKFVVSYVFFVSVYVIFVLV